MIRHADVMVENFAPVAIERLGLSYDVVKDINGRRMTEYAARLVDEVLPRVPVRQWVLSLPYRLRYLLDHDALTSSPWRG
jgi:hypothetical protein